MSLLSLASLCSLPHGVGERGPRRLCQGALLTQGTSTAEWWAAASWREWLVVVVDVLFVVMVKAPLHCAAAQALSFSSLAAASSSSALPSSFGGGCGASSSRVWWAAVAGPRHGHGVRRSRCSRWVLHLLPLLAPWNSRTSCLPLVLFESWTSERSAGERLAPCCMRTLVFGHVTQIARL